MIGWSGPELVVLAKLQRVGADRGDDGRFIVSGAPVRYSLKSGVLHVAIPVDAVFFVRGQRRSFATILDGVPSINPLLDKASNIFGPLNAKQKQEIMDYIAAPTEAGWDRIASMIILPGTMGRTTIWQWVVQVEPTFPRSKPSPGRWPRIPDPMTVARAIKAAAAARGAAGNPRDHRHKPPESAAQLVKLQERIAEKLGWTLKDVQSMSLQSLRENVRPVSPKLANELTTFIRSGPLRNPDDGWRGNCPGATYDASIRLRRGGRISPDLYERVHVAVEHQPEIACVTSQVKHGTRIELAMRLGHRHAKDGLVALQQALARATAGFAGDLEVTDLGHAGGPADLDGWIVISEGRPISFRTYANDALDGEDGDDTRRVLAMMRGQRFPLVSPARIPMSGCDGKVVLVEVHRSRKDWKAAKRPRANPMATAQEMLDAIFEWLGREDLVYGVKFKSPEEWRKLGWDAELGMPETRDGFVIIAEGTNFNHALAGWMDHDRGEEKKIYDSWNRLLEHHGWAWSAFTGWAFHVYPQKAQVGSTATPRAVAHTPPAVTTTVTTPKTTKGRRSRKRESNVKEGAGDPYVARGMYETAILRAWDEIRRRGETPSLYRVQLELPDYNREWIDSVWWELARAGRLPGTVGRGARA